MKEYARSKKLDKEASTGKAGVALGHVEGQEDEQWGEQGDWEWEDINAVGSGKFKEHFLGNIKGKGTGHIEEIQKGLLWECDFSYVTPQCSCIKIMRCRDVRRRRGWGDRWLAAGWAGWPPPGSKQGSESKTKE